MVVLFFAIYIGKVNSDLSTTTETRAVVLETVTKKVDLDQTEIEDLTNSYRESESKGLLVRDNTLCEYAKERITDLPVDYSHGKFYEESNRFMQKYGYTALGENLTAEYPTTEAVFAGWKSSPTHNENLLDSRFNKSCVVCENLYGKPYCVQLFGRK